MNILKYLQLGGISDRVGSGGARCWTAMKSSKHKWIGIMPVGV